MPNLDTIIAEHFHGKAVNLSNFIPTKVPSNSPVPDVAGSVPRSKNMLDVHIFDGKLNIPEFNSIIDNDVKQVLGNKLISILSTPVSKNMVVKILNESKDQANGVYPSDILVSILTNDNLSLDLLVLLEEQLTDMFLLGQCPQGQTTRLYSILSCLY